MEDFDIDINFNGVENDLLYLNANGDTETENKPVTEEKPTEKEKKTTTKKPNWTTQLDKYTNLFKGLSSYETPAQRQARLEKEKQEQGKRTTIFGLNPLVAIGISFVVIIGGVVAVVKLKGK